MLCSDILEVAAPSWIVDLSFRSVRLRFLGEDYPLVVCPLREILYIWPYTCRLQNPSSPHQLQEVPLPLYPIHIPLRFPLPHTIFTKVKPTPGIRCLKQTESSLASFNSEFGAEETRATQEVDDGPSSERMDG